ncbi:MAG: hypothetical protein ABFD12_09945 [Syntrophorhabdus sp.]
MDTRDLPEYHLLFESQDGDVTLNVKFPSPSQAKGRSFPSKQIRWRDVLRLFGGPDGMPYENMNFDEWPFAVNKIEIEPVKRLVTLTISGPIHRTEVC